MKNYDVVIVGAGIIGLSIAWQLARRSALRIAVIEKGAAVGEGSTGASSAICRVRYSNDEMLLLARDGTQAYRHWGAFTELGNPAADFHEDGVLWMPGGDRSWADKERIRMQNFGVAAEVLDDDDIAERFPALSTCTLAPDLETGEAHDCVGDSRNLFEIEGGHIDPVAAVRDLVEACRKAGVEVRFGRRVTGIGTAAPAAADPPSWRNSSAIPSSVWPLVMSPVATPRNRVWPVSVPKTAALKMDRSAPALPAKSGSLNS